jgi:hypothetical protein
MIWSKAFVMERERYDGADVAHVILRRAGSSTGTGCCAASSPTGASC